MKKEEVISRRSFFKRSASIVLPALAMVALPSVLTSCEIDEEDLPFDTIKTGCDGCKGVCGSSCQTECTGSCTNGCKGSCRASCSGSGCRSLCTGKSRY